MIIVALHLILRFGGTDENNSTCADDETVQDYDSMLKAGLKELRLADCGCSLSYLEPCRCEFPLKPSVQHNLGRAIEHLQGAIAVGVPQQDTELVNRALAIAHIARAEVTRNTSAKQQDYQAAHRWDSELGVAACYVRQLTEHSACKGRGLKVCKGSPRAIASRMYYKSGFAHTVNSMVNVGVAAAFKKNHLDFDFSWNHGCPNSDSHNISECGWSSLFQAISPSSKKKLELGKSKKPKNKASCCQRKTCVALESMRAVARRKVRAFYSTPDEILLAFRNYAARHLTLQPAAREAVNAIKAQFSLESGEYAAFHIRRGDKVKSGAYAFAESEMDAVHGAQYVSSLLRKLEQMKDGSTRKVFVATDDYESVREIQAAAPDLEVFTFSKDSAKGYDQKKFDDKSNAKRFDHSIQLWAEIEIMRDAKVFVACLASNVARLVQILRKQQADSLVAIGSDSDWFEGHAYL